MHMIIKRMIQRKSALISSCIALFCLFVFIPLLFNYSNEAKTTVSHTIEKHGRGIYDLLVRPQNSRTNIEKTLGVVEENYIGDSSGGISLHEWQEINAYPDIEVAAPIASIGYFRGVQLSMELPIPDSPTRFSYQFFTSNGMNKYPLGEADKITFFEQYRPGFNQYINALSEDRAFSAVMHIIMPESYYPLVAVDPENETILTGIDFSKLNEEINMGNPIIRSQVEGNGNTPIVKVLQRNNLNVPLSVEMDVDTIDVQLEDYLKKLNLNKDQFLMEAPREKLIEANKDLEKADVLSTQRVDLNLTKFQHPFNQTPLILNDKLEPQITEGFSGNADTSIYYTASKIKYENLNDTPEVNIIQEGKPPLYRNVQKKGVSIEDVKGDDIPFNLIQMGSFSTSDVPKNKLVASPLAIYGEMEVKSLDGKTLTPTTEPGSFITAPASGVTTLDAAEFIKGNRPIDAIRVKVANIHKYDQNAQKKIERIATDLLKQGYEVDVVAGASFKKMTVDVEGIGKVIEPWTTLGVAQSLTTRWNSTIVTTTVLLIAFSLLWLMARITFERNMLLEENQLLHMIGWRKSKIKLRNFVEYAFTITSIFFISIITLIFSKASGYMYWLSFGLWITAIVLALYLIYKKQKSQIRTRAYKRFASLFYYKRFIVPMMFIFLLAFLLVAIQFSGLAFSFYESSTTSLGEFMNNTMFWIQILIIALTLMLSAISIAECLNAQLLERKEEFSMYHTIGWTKRMVFKRLVEETFMWLLPVLLVGIFVNGISSSLLGVPILWNIFGSFIALLLFFCISFAILLTRQLFNTQ